MKYDAEQLQHLNQSLNGSGFFISDDSGRTWVDMATGRPVSPLQKVQAMYGGRAVTITQDAMGRIVIRANVHEFEQAIASEKVDEMPHLLQMLVAKFEAYHAIAPLRAANLQGNNP